MTNASTVSITLGVIITTSSGFSISFFRKDLHSGLQHKHTLHTCAVFSVTASTQILKRLPLQPYLLCPSRLPAMSTSARRRLMRDFKVCSPRILLLATTTFIFRSIQFRIVSSTCANNVQRMQTDPPAGVSASPVADNVMTWYVDSDPTPTTFSTC